MGGGLMQLVAYGAQDIYLTGNPQITFFKVVYRRHTNFSMETIQQTISGSSTGKKGSSGTVTVSRNGDLLHKVYVNSSTGDCRSGSSIIQDVELEIGGQMIDKQSSEWNNIWNELSTTESKALGLKSMQAEIGIRGNGGVNTLQVPLNFWFCRNPGLSLPLIALQYHEVKLKFNWGGENVFNVNVYVDYIYLDTDERRRFAQVSHEYLIEQLQKVSVGNKKEIDINLNHPIKELIWTGSGYGKANIVLNGHDRFEPMPEEYFQLRQPFDHHTAIPRQNLPSSSQVSLLDRQTQLKPLDYHAILGGAGGDREVPSLAFSFDTSDSASWTSGGMTVISDMPREGLALGDGELSCQFVISNGRICLVGDLDGDAGTTENAPREGKNDSMISFDEKNPIGTELILNISGEAFRVIRDGGIGGIISQGFIDDDDDDLFHTDIADHVKDQNSAPGGNADATNGIDVWRFVIEGPIIKLTDQSIPGDITSATWLDDAEEGKGYCSLFKTGNVSSNEARTSKMTEKINVYSFSLKPEEHQPSGTCNFSRIDNAQLKTDSNFIGDIYAVNYNVLRIMSGMGGLAYSN